MSQEQQDIHSREYDQRVKARKIADACARNARKDPDMDWSDLDIAQMWKETFEYELTNLEEAERSFYD